MISETWQTQWLWLRQLHRYRLCSNTNSYMYILFSASGQIFQRIHTQISWLFFVCACLQKNNSWPSQMNAADMLTCRVQTLWPLLSSSSWVQTLWPLLSSSSWVQTLWPLLPGLSQVQILWPLLPSLSQVQILWALLPSLSQVQILWPL